MKNRQTTDQRRSRMQWGRDTISKHRAVDEKMAVTNQARKQFEHKPYQNIKKGCEHNEKS